MKKTRILSIITMFIAVVLIVTGYSIIFVNEYRVDAHEKSSYASLIRTSFTSYSKDIENISHDIKTIDIFNIKYYAELKINYSNNINKLNGIEMKIREIEAMSESLLYECNIREYYDYDIEYKCDVISYNYESIINAYVSMVEKYNERIDYYNDWIIIKNNLNNNKLMRYKSNYYTDYIDINNDNIYSGKIK